MTPVGQDDAAPASLRPMAELPGAAAWLDAAPALLFARSADGTQVWLSARWLEVLGARDLAELQAGWRARLDAGVDPLGLPPGETRCRLRNAQGRMQVFTVRVAPATAGAAGGPAWLGSAELQAESDTDFLAFASHELRSPLNAIRGWSHVLRKSSGELNAMQQKALDTIDRSVSVQARLIDDLLDRQRLLRGQVPLEPQRVRLADVLAEALQAVQPAAHEKSLTLTLDAADDLWLDADPRRLGQAMAQVLGHALKHTPAQGSIAIAAQACDGRAHIALTDGAQGLDAAALDAALAQPAKGLGLAQYLVELHGGRLVAQAGETGTLFHIELPLAAR